MRIAKSMSQNPGSRTSSAASSQDVLFEIVLSARLRAMVVMAKNIKNLHVLHVTYLLFQVA